MNSEWYSLIKNVCAKGVLKGTELLIGTKHFSIPLLQVKEVIGIQ